MIKAVLFDVDGVLIDSFEANLKFFQDLMIAAGYKPPSRDQYSGMFHLNLVSVIKTLAKPDSKKEFDRIYKMADSRDVEYDISLVSTPEGIEKILESLSRRYALGIVTGRIENSVYEVPALKALRSYFKVAIAHEDTDKYKPDPEPLLLAAQRLDVKPEEVVYIGDAYTDLQAAKAAGMKFISYPDNINGADAHTNLFLNLPEVINNLQ